MLTAEMAVSDNLTQKKRLKEWTAFVEKQLPQWCSGPAQPPMLFTGPVKPGYEYDSGGEGPRYPSGLPALDPFTGEILYLDGDGKDLVSLQLGGEKRRIGQLDPTFCERRDVTQEPMMIGVFHAFSRLDDANRRPRLLAVPSVGVLGLEVSIVETDAILTLKLKPLASEADVFEITVYSDNVEVSGVGFSGSLPFSGTESPTLSLSLTPNCLLATVEGYNCHMRGDGIFAAGVFLPLPLKNIYPPFLISCGESPQLVFLPFVIAPDLPSWPWFSKLPKSPYIQSSLTPKNPPKPNLEGLRAIERLDAAIRKDDFPKVAKEYALAAKLFKGHRFFAQESSPDPDYPRSIAIDAFGCQRSINLEAKDLAKTKTTIAKVGAVCKTAIEKWSRAEESIRSATLAGGGKVDDTAVPEQKKLRDTICQSARNLFEFVANFRGRYGGNYETEAKAILKEHSLCFMACPFPSWWGE